MQNFSFFRSGSWRIESKPEMWRLHPRFWCVVCECWRLFDCNIKITDPSRHLCFVIISKQKQGLFHLNSSISRRSVFNLLQKAKYFFGKTGSTDHLTATTCRQRYTRSIAIRPYFVPEWQHSLQKDWLNGKGNVTVARRLTIGQALTWPSIVAIFAIGGLVITWLVLPNCKSFNVHDFDGTAIN